MQESSDALEKEEKRRPITLDEISKNIKNERKNGSRASRYRCIKGKSPSKLATKKFQVKKTPKTDELERKKGDQTKIKIKSKDGKKKKKRNLCCGSPKARAWRALLCFFRFLIFRLYSLFNIDERHRSHI
jgi:hypothetical protein